MTSTTNPMTMFSISDIARESTVNADIENLDERELILELIANRQRLADCEAREIALLAHYADVATEPVEAAIHLMAESPHTPAARFGEQLVAVGGDGTPLVGEFINLEVAAAFREPVEWVDARMGTALNLRHRFPTLWHLVMCGRVRWFTAEKICYAAEPLNENAARTLDARIAGQVETMTTAAAVRLAKGLVLDLLPAEQADQLRRDDHDQRGVWITPRGTGTSSISGQLNSADAVVLDQQLSRLATILKQGGHEGSRDQLRAQALGVLATPARALQWFQASILDQLPDDPDDQQMGDCPLIDRPGHLCGTVTVPPEKLLPKAELVVHLTDETLRTQTGVIRAEQCGPLLAEWLEDLLGHHRISLTPVLIPDSLAPTDSYEIPDPLRRAVQLRDPREAFPGSKHNSRQCDLDHVIPYDPDGPPGQTRYDNLVPLSRRLHRAKTHGGWRYSQPEPGITIWRSPLGFEYASTSSQSVLLATPDPRPHPTARAS